MDIFWSAFVTALATIIGSFVTWKIAKRKTSGSVATTEAATLWAESQAMRKELRDEVVGLRDELADLKTHAESLQRDNSKLLAKIKSLEKRIRSLLRKIKSLENKLKKLGEEI